MKVLVNALSATAPSGQHVLFGHVRQLAQWTVDTHEYHILSCPKTKPDNAEFGPNVFWHMVPQAGETWFSRTIWETKSLPRWMIAEAMDLYFTPTGTILPRSPLPQVTVASNPWCMTTAVPKTFRERCKAVIQRSAYRTAQRSADLMVYTSAHMQRLYKRNAYDREARRGLVVYPGIHDGTHELAEKTRDPLAKDRNTILSVSVMARWKNCETLIRALRQLHDEGIRARLRLIGGWPDAVYRREIEAELSRLNLTQSVSLEGHVSLEELHAAYRTAGVYALLSKCESFGIPAIESQAFGTPVVGSNTCAMPEIGGDGGIFVAPDDVAATANALRQLLTTDAVWTEYSDRAIRNSQRFRWEECSQPLLEMFTLGNLSESRSRSESHANDATDLAEVATQMNGAR